MKDLLIRLKLIDFLTTTIQADKDDFVDNFSSQIDEGILVYLVIFSKYFLQAKMNTKDVFIPIILKLEGERSYLI